MGITKREIASELGVSKRTVANYIEKLGLGNHVSRNGNTDFLDDFAAVAKSAAGTDYSEFPRPRVPVPADELSKYETLAVDAYIAAKAACDRLVDKYAVNLPDGGDLNDGSTGAAASPAQRAHVQDRSIERSVGVRER